MYRLYITEARRVNYIDKAIHDRLDSAYIGTTATLIPGNRQTASLAGQPTLRRLQWSCTRRITHTPQRYRKLLISVQAGGHAPLRTCYQLVERGWVISCGGDWGSRRVYAGFGDLEITVSGSRGPAFTVYCGWSGCRSSGNP